jgi:hypothetical protein
MRVHRVSIHIRDRAARRGKANLSLAPDYSSERVINGKREIVTHRVGSPRYGICGNYPTVGPEQAREENRPHRKDAPSSPVLPPSGEGGRGTLGEGFSRAGMHEKCQRFLSMQSKLKRSNRLPCHSRES